MCLVALLLSYFNSTPSNRMAAFHRRMLFQRQRVRNRHYCTMVNEIGTCHRISQNSSWVSLLLVYWVIGYCTCICGILFLLPLLLTGSNSVTLIFITRFRSIDHCIVVVSGHRRCIGLTFTVLFASNRRHQFNFSGLFKTGDSPLSAPYSFSTILCHWMYYYPSYVWLMVMSRFIHLQTTSAMVHEPASLDTIHDMRLTLSKISPVCPLWYIVSLLAIVAAGSVYSSAAS